jgi:hypothetical protein
MQQDRLKTGTRFKVHRLLKSGRHESKKSHMRLTFEALNKCSMSNVRCSILQGVWGKYAMLTALLGVQA